MKLRRPAPRPCEACPYRVDAPSRLWADSEYAKLPAFDLPTPAQPTGVFQCHTTGARDPRSRVCAGWAAVHRKNPRGHELLSLRLAEALGTMDPQDLRATLVYRTTVELWASGEAAAAHGMAEIDHPSLRTTLMIDKIQRRRGDLA